MNEAIIEAVSRTVKTMADGTLRLTVDISPIHAQAAFIMFGMPDIPMVLARLTPEAAKSSAQAEAIAKEPITGLPLLAVQWCKDSVFWKWIRHENLAWITSEEECAQWIKDFIGIETRRELETNQEAIAMFNQEIRGPYMLWLKDNLK